MKTKIASSIMFIKITDVETLKNIYILNLISNSIIFFTKIANVANKWKPTLLEPWEQTKE